LRDSRISTLQTASTTPPPLQAHIAATSVKKLMTEYTGTSDIF
jgi:hypothetical protein